MLAAATHLGTATLLVRDLTIVRAFYEKVLGFMPMRSSATEVTFASSGRPFLILKEDRSLEAAPKGGIGLYHIGFLFESPARLAATLLRILKTTPALFEGSADHLVSQAFYLHDPEGNGIELYVDRPRSEWKYVNGQLQMDTLPIDTDGFIMQHLAEGGTGQVSLGHIHFKVGNASIAQYFFTDILGFSMTGMLPSAVFVSAGGYHHHLAANVWETNGAKPEGQYLGLEKYEILVPTTSALDEVEERLIISKISYERTPEILTFNDPWNIGIEMKKVDLQI